MWNKKKIDNTSRTILIIWYINAKTRKRNFSFEYQHELYINGFPAPSWAFIKCFLYEYVCNLQNMTFPFENSSATFQELQKSLVSAFSHTLRATSRWVVLHSQIAQHSDKTNTTENQHGVLNYRHYSFRICSTTENKASVALKSQAQSRTCHQIHLMSRHRLHLWLVYWVFVLMILAEHLLVFDDALHCP